MADETTHDPSTGDGSSSNGSTPAGKPADTTAGPTQTPTPPAGQRDTDPEKAEREKVERDRRLAAAAKAGGAVADGLAKSTQEMSAQAAKNEADIRSERRELLQQKLGLEAERRNANAQVESLTELISGGTEKEKIAETTFAALEMASWAFANIITALDDAARFWTNLQAACERLQKSRLVSDIKEIQEQNAADRQARIEEYNDAFFKREAITYLVGWQALHVVCEQYNKAALEARLATKRRIEQAPTVAEARSQLEGLKSALKKSLREDSSASDERSAELQKHLRETVVDEPDPAGQLQETAR